MTHQLTKNCLKIILVLSLNPNNPVNAQLCWCNIARESSASVCEPFNNPSVEPPATGTCQNEHGCVYDYMQKGTQLYCADNGVDNVSEYAVMNGEVFNVRHQCNEHLCRPEYLLSLLDCPWLMAPSDEGTQRLLRCKCNQGLRCMEGECSYVGETIPDGMMPSCRYWHFDRWEQPIIDCWFTSQPYDRQVYSDANTTYVMCRDANYCNDEPAVQETMQSTNHCPLFAVQAFHERLAKMNPKSYGGPPKVDELGQEIEYGDMEVHEPGDGGSDKATRKNTGYVDVDKGTEGLRVDRTNETGTMRIDDKDISLLTNDTKDITENIDSNSSVPGMNDSHSTTLPSVVTQMLSSKAISRVTKLLPGSRYSTTAMLKDVEQDLVTVNYEGEKDSTERTLIVKASTDKLHDPATTQSVTPVHKVTKPLGTSKPSKDYEINIEPKLPASNDDIYEKPSDSQVIDARVQIWPPNKILLLTILFVVVVAVFLLAVSVYVCSMI